MIPCAKFQCHAFRVLIIIWAVTMQRVECHADSWKTFNYRALSNEECSPVAKCEICTFTDQKTFADACKPTGRMQKFKCVEFEDEEESKGGIEMRSCKHTEADEEFAMIRLQMFCCLIGGMALMSVKRQKRVSASLFDQRKERQQESKRRGRRESDIIQEDVELTRMEQETVPLVESSSNPLEVI